MMHWRLLLVWFCALCTAKIQGEVLQSRVVNITQGPVKGYKESQNVYAFYNIPYATVTDRFKAPGPPPNWTETFEAVNREILCPQRPMANADLTTKTLQEDCLVANVIVPDTENRNLPVLVNIHGGAFSYGYNNGERFTSFVAGKQVVVVTFNYRLGVFGFLCLGTEGAPGNAGLKDQLALLRWVKLNIASFGGNPDDVTISGCSAGSGSVDLLTISPTTKGLFNKAISESGSNLAAFVVQQDPITNAMNSAKALNFSNVEDISALEEFYRTASMELLLSLPPSGKTNSALTFSPCVERDIGDERFLPEAPYTTLRRGDHVKYPRIYGFTNMEGLMRLPLFPIWSNAMNENFSDFLPADLHFETQAQKNEVAQIVKEFYFGNQPVNLDSILSYIDYFTDVNFAYSMLRAAKLHVEAGNSTIYLHMYSFYDNNTMPIFRGANHCQQSMAVWDEDETNISEEYRNMKNIMRELWSSFILTGKPVKEGSSLPVWLPVGENRSPHMSLGTTVEKKGPLLEARAQFWDKIYEQYYIAPAPPSTDSAFVHKNICLAYILIALYFLS